MKHIYKVKLLFVMSLFTLASCVDEDLVEFIVEKPESIALQEELNTYDVLKDYLNNENNSDFILGVNTNMDYLSEGTVLSRIINSNFNGVISSSIMSHHSIIQSNGSSSFDNLNSFLELANTNNLSVFGGPLVWNKMQNSNYLNGLIDPLVISIPAVTNYLDKTSVSDQSFSEFSSNGSGTLSYASGKGIAGGDAIKFVSGSDVVNGEDFHVVTPNIDIVEGHEYEVILYIKSETKGEGSITFDGLDNNSPEIDWSQSGMASQTFSTTLVWKAIKFKISDFTSTSFNLKFNFGYKPNVTYYIDINTLYVKDVADTGDEDGPKNYPSSGDKIWLEAECGSFSEESRWEKGDDATASEGKYIMVPGSGGANTSPSLDLVKEVVTYDFEVLSSGTFNLFVRATFESSQWSDDSFFVKVDDGAWVTCNGVVNDPNFKWYNVTNFNIQSGTGHKLYLAFREDGSKIDKFYLTNGADAPEGTEDLGGVAANCGGVLITADKTPEEKEYVVNDEMEKWVSNVVDHSKESIKVWNVIDEPMDDQDPTNIKTSASGSVEANEFYWQDYLGKDYGVKAFKLARQNGNQNDLLFISDNNLDSNIDKCNGLIQYIEYIEANGAQVDGISTKMSISIYEADKDKIASMFELLAATGKKIAVTNFSLKVETGVPTSDILDQQKEMYKYIISTYNQKIPKAQQYGIFVEGLRDTENEFSGLWTEQYSYRKRAYSGVVEGLEEF